ncbi:hypothetical protein BBJ29_005570 [Phytophthora kernoviae]|uniref:Calponin-homology (CH) domain-containing protein n=1 Tax=Phytophthora kernoviae TaxID=325452 RepID=A0A3F2RH25_9STRA|nr:hypothetical protein BBJ29_005570 [Phytophthora kernoviae]RLN56706.1 hypothetical protein BBP00_00007867 [Phytophthora kernoviae]
MRGNAYFVGRKELLEWLNTVCGTELTSVEQTCSGAVACQVLDALYPGKVPMNKVDWTVVHDYEFVQNYKLLQKCFFVLKIDKQIPVDRLVRGKYQDNLEFMQWLKAFYDRHEQHGPYDPIARREKGKGGAQYNSKLCGLAAMVATRIQTPTRANALMKPNKKSACRATGSSAKVGVSCGDGTGRSYCTMASQERGINILKAENKALTDHNEELRVSLGIVEKDRDFYYTKMEAIEKLIHEIELSDTADEETATSILEVLYAAE